MATSVSTFQTRLEAAETAYDQMMTDGRGIVRYREPGGNFIEKDPAAMQAYIEYLQRRIAAKTAGSTTTVVSLGRVG